MHIYDIDEYKIHKHVQIKITLKLFMKGKFI